MAIAADQSPAQNKNRRRAAFIIGGMVLLAALAASGWWIWFWSQRAPKAARLLPESDAVIYVNLRPLRLARLFASLPPVKPDSGYADFMQATGFEFERDLDSVAIAMHLPKASLSANQPSAPAPNQARFSEVFIGRFDVPRLSAWLRKNCNHMEQMEGHEVFALPVEDRTVRVALISSHLVLATNTEDIDVLRQMLRSSAALRAPEGPRVVREHYRDVPAGSLAWALSQPGKNLPLPNGLEIPIPAGTTWVASLRYAGEIQLQAQALTASDEDARQVAESLGTLLALFRSIQANTQARGPDADVKAFFDSLEVHQDQNRAVVTAEMPAGFIQKLANGMEK